MRTDDKKKLNSLNDSTNNSSTDTSSAGSHRLFCGSVGVDGALGLGGVGAALGLLALLVRLVDGDRVPGGGVGHAALLLGDIVLKERSLVLWGDFSGRIVSARRREINLQSWIPRR